VRSRPPAVLLTQRQVTEGGGHSGAELAGSLASGCLAPHATPMAKPCNPLAPRATAVTPGCPPPNAGR
jgi:hypothetical protein